MLKTDKREGSDHSCVIDGTKSDFLHDAAYAHALVLTIGEIGVTDDGGYAQYCPASDTQSFLRERAEELMREWGYWEVDDETA